MIAELPSLSPDVSFEPLRNCSETFAFSFAVKKEALGPHICARWSWDEEYQRRIHRDRLEQKPFYAIRQNEIAVGTLSWALERDHARFGEFYLFRRFQNMGLGTRILRHALAQADAAGLAVRLEYLKWNPVGRLYLRHGFRPTHESDIHVFLERPPGSAA